MNLCTISGRFHRIVLTSAVLCVAALYGVNHAAPVDAWFSAANTFYEQKQYDSAAAYYEKVTGSGLKNSDLLYNLGNAYFRLNKIGPAILSYEKALKLSPNDPDIQSNIKFANLNIVDKSPEPARTLFEAALLRLHTLLSLQMQIWVLLGLLVALSALFVIAIFAPHNTRLWMIYLSVLLMVPTALIGTSAGLRIYEEEKTPRAIVLVPAVDARNQPDGTTVLFTVHEGTKFRIRKTSGAWALVTLANGVSGWVEMGALGMI